MSDLKVLLWNMSWQGDQAPMVDALVAMPWDVAVLCEVKPHARKVLEAECPTAAFAGDLVEGRRHPFSAAVLVRGNLQIGRAELVAGTRPDGPKVVPDKALAVEVTQGQRAVTVVGFHAPYAAGAPENKFGKQDAYRQVISYINDHADEPLVVAMDSNHVMSDVLDMSTLPEAADDPWRDEVLFMRSQGHGLQDAQRMWIAADAARSAAVPAKGPLAVTYRRKNSERGDRMDRIWVSQHFEVVGAAAEYERAVDLGSDHAIVTADLRWLEAT